MPLFLKRRCDWTLGAGQLDAAAAAAAHVARLGPRHLASVDVLFLPGRAGGAAGAGAEAGVDGAKAEAEAAADGAAPAEQPGGVWLPLPDMAVARARPAACTTAAGLAVVGGCRAPQRLASL